MPTRIRMIHRPFGLVPETKLDAEALATLPLHAAMTVEVSFGASEEARNFYEKLTRLVADGIGLGHEKLKHELKVKTGRVEHYVVKGQAMKIVPKSTTKMDDVEFRTYLDAAIDVILRDHLPHMTKTKLVREVERMLGLTLAVKHQRPIARNAA